MNVHDLTDHWSLQASWWFLGLVIVGSALPGLFALARSLYHRGLASSARAATTDVSRALSVGPRVVAGAVVVDGDDPAIAVRLLLRGTQSNLRGAVRHAWVEHERQLTSRPFVVRTKDGEEISVSPPSDVRFCHELRTEPMARAERRLVGELRHGDRVVVVGRVARTANDSAYRTPGGPPWRLESPRVGVMVVSTIPLDEMARTRATLLLQFGCAFLALTLLSSAMAWSLFDRQRSGHLETAEIVRVVEEAHECRLEYRYDSDPSRYRTRAIRIDAQTCATVYPGDRLRLTVSGGSVQLGSEPGLDTESAYLPTLLWLLLAFGSVKMYRDTFAWYERSRFRQTGPGALGGPVG